MVLATSERTMGTVKMIFGILLIVTCVYVGAELIPVYYANYEFQDVIKTEATLETYTTKPESDIQDMIYKKAQDLQIPLNKEQVKVARRGTTGTGSLSIQAPYIVHVDLPVYPFDIHFDPSTENKSPF
jgi:cell division protein FtsL